MEGYKNFDKQSTKVYPLTKVAKEKLIKVIKQLNSIYKREKIDFRIHNILYKLNNSNNEAVTNFFIYPTHKLYLFNGKAEEHIGYKVTLLKRDDIKKNKKKCFNITFENINRSDKLIEIVIGDNDDFIIHDKNDFIKIIKASLKMNVSKKIIYTDTVGWIQGNNKMHYAPITNLKARKIICSSQLIKRHKIKADNSLEKKQLFDGIINMLDITKRELTIPLLAFTVLSSLGGLIKRRNIEYPEFLLCLHSNSKSPLTIALANLFCNVFNRTKHIYSIDSKIHNTQSTYPEIVEKASKINDAPIINQFSSSSKLVTYIKLMKRSSNGVIALSSEELDHTSVINLDTNVSINQEILNFHKENPAIFSTWFISFIQHTQNELSDEKWGLDNKKLIDKFYKECSFMITDDKAEYDINKLRHSAWLLLAYLYFLNYGLKNKLIDENQFATMSNEAIDIFRDLSKINVNIENDRKEESPISFLKKDTLNYLHTLDKILKENNLLQFEDKMNYSSKDFNNYFGFIDKDSIYLNSSETSNVYKTVYSNLNEQKEKLTSKNTEIYEYLFNNKLLFLKDGDTAEKMKKGSYTRAIALKNKSTKRFLHLDLQAIKKFLLDNGHTLQFLKNK